MKKASSSGVVRLVNIANLPGFGGEQANIAETKANYNVVPSNSRASYTDHELILNILFSSTKRQKQNPINVSSKDR